MDQNPNRFWSKVANTNHVAPMFDYVWDQAALITGNPGGPVTGAFRPLSVADLRDSLALSYDSTVVTNTTPSGNGSAMITGLLFPDTPIRKQYFIQNLAATNPLFVKHGTGITSTTSMSYVLPFSTANYAGNGGQITNTTYTGPVSVSGLNALFIAWQV